MHVMYDDIFTQRVASLNWTFAKTMPESPHEYIVRGKTVSDELFKAMFFAIESGGVLGEWDGVPYLYLYPGDGYRYWKMTDNIDESMIINRAPQK